MLCLYFVKKMLKNLELAKWIHHSKGKTDDSLEEGRCFEWRGKDMGEARICPETDVQASSG